MQLLCHSVIYEILLHDYRHRMSNLIIRKLQNTPPTGYKSSTMEKGTICVCVYDTIATGLSDLSLLEQDKEEITYRWGSIFICICHKAPSCFMLPCVSEDLHTEREFFITGSASKNPTDHSHCKKYSKIKLHGPCLIWCPMTCDLLNLTRHHFPTLPYRPTPAQFFLGEK